MGIDEGYLGRSWGTRWGKHGGFVMGMGQETQDAGSVDRRVETG